MTDAIAARGHAHRLVPVTRMVGRIDGGVAIRGLDDCDAVIVRGIPRGSLEQVIFRVDALHVLGVPCLNSPRAIERTVDKFLASALLARAGVPTPRTIACERVEDALDAFAELGGDVIVKPLFGSMGAGMTRVDDADVAYRVFHALALERAVYYLQETLRRVVTCERSSWAAGCSRRSNGSARVAGEPRARGRSGRDGVDRRAGARLPGGGRAAGASDYAGVDLLGDYVLELNGIPGWHGLEAATGADVAAALVAHLEPWSTQLVRSDDARCSAVVDERARGAGGGERAHVLDVAHAAAGEQLEFGELGVEFGDQPRRRARRHCRRGQRSRTITSRSRAAVQPPPRRRAPVRPRAADRVTAVRPVLQVDAQHHVAYGSSASSAPRRPASPSRRSTRSDAERQQLPRLLRLADPRVDHQVQLLRGPATDRGTRSTPVPVIASRSATYSSSSASSDRNARASFSGSPPSAVSTL